MNCISAIGRMPMSAAPIGAPDDGRLADRACRSTRVVAELLQEARRDAEGAAVGAHVLADARTRARPAPSPRAWRARMASRYVRTAISVRPCRRSHSATERRHGRRERRGRRRRRSSADSGSGKRALPRRTPASSVERGVDARPRAPSSSPCEATPPCEQWLLVAGDAGPCAAHASSSSRGHVLHVVVLGVAAHAHGVGLDQRRALAVARALDRRAA